MRLPTTLQTRLSPALDRSGDWLLPTLARFVFAATLAGYFWASGLTKLGDGFFGFLHPSVGAYAQIFPRTMEAVVYDVSQLSLLHWAVVTAGTWAEFILPALIILGLFARLASLGMIGFVFVQSLTDLFGHGALDDPAAFGAWFDRHSDALILDQRTFWMLLFLVIIFKRGRPPLARPIGLQGGNRLAQKCAFSSSGLPAAKARTPATPTIPIGNIVAKLKPNAAYIPSAEAIISTPPHNARARAIAPPAIANSGARKLAVFTKAGFSKKPITSPTSLNRSTSVA